MKSRPKQARDASAADALIESAGVDPEITKTTETPKKKAQSKLGKSNPKNPDYHKGMYYLKAENRTYIETEVFKRRNLKAAPDLSDVIDAALELLAENPSRLDEYCVNLGN